MFRRPRSCDLILESALRADPSGIFSISEWAGQSAPRTEIESVGDLDDT